MKTYSPAPPQSNQSIANVSRVILHRHQCGTWSVEHSASRSKHCSVPNRNLNARDPILVALGATIRRVRLARSVSQERLALIAAVDRSYMGRIERGDNAVAVLTLVKLAAALDTTASDLMEQAGL